MPRDLTFRPPVRTEPIVQEFIDFCRSKPADEAYNYCSVSDCAFARFLKARGLSDDPRVACDGWTDNAGQPHPMPDGVEKAVNADPETFGALADRLETALADRLAALL